MATQTSMASAPHQRWWRIIPVAFLMYTIAFMDRINIGFGIPGMEKSLGIAADVAGLASGIFFFGYMFLQIPGGQLAVKWSAKKFVLFSLVVWGIFAILTGLVQNTAELLIVRFILGVAEGGVWPATLVLLSRWFPNVGVFWTLPPMFLNEETVGSGMGLINALGNLGGFVGPYIIGYFILATGSNLTGITILSISLVAGGIMTILFRVERRSQAYSVAGR